MRHDGATPQKFLFNQSPILYEYIFRQLPRERRAESQKCTWRPSSISCALLQRLTCPCVAPLPGVAVVAAGSCCRAPKLQRSPQVPPPCSLCETTMPPPPSVKPASAQGGPSAASQPDQAADPHRRPVRPDNGGGPVVLVVLGASGGGVRGTRAVPFDGARALEAVRQKLVARGPCAGLVLVSSGRREESAFRASSMRARRQSIRSRAPCLSNSRNPSAHKQSAVVRSRDGLQIDRGRRNFTHARLPLADSNRNPRRSRCLHTHTGR
ncbi:hypothetical protein ON010_g17858 [Phytophthora cinnamomi]|nr:hypothetical protein ON010_g17858 [Phytophthora cinnamomi]